MYPVSHVTGCSSNGLYPPFHDCGRGHFTTSDEFILFLQLSLSTYTSVPPNQVDLSIHSLHCVEFHLNEYVPAEHSEQVELFIIISPGCQYLNDTLIVSFVGKFRYDTLLLSISLQVAMYSILVSPGM